MRVLILGGGVAGVEAALALHALAGERVELELLSPRPELIDRPQGVHAPFDGSAVPRLPLDRLEHLGVRLREGALASVDAPRGEVHTAAGAVLPYDRLIVATGGRLKAAVPGALAFGGPTAAGRLDALLARHAQARLAFVVPPGPGWPLPVYELALLTARRLPDADVIVVTPEERPLGLFGAQAARVVAGVLDAAGVGVRTASTATGVVDGALMLAGGGLLAADAVVAGPSVSGPRIPGLPADRDGFVVTDGLGAVPGCAGVYAAGDVTSGAIKQGGLAAQQADAVAAAIAAAAGAPVHPAPARRVLRGLLLTGGEPLYLRGELVHGGHTVDSAAAHEALWWPPVKLAGRHLASFLVSGGTSLEPLTDRLTPTVG